MTEWALPPLEIPTLGLYRVREMGWARNIGLILLLASVRAGAAPRVLTQPLDQLVDDLRIFMPQKGSNQYVVPTSADRAAFRTAITALITGDVQRATQAIEPYGTYELVDYTDGPGGPKYWAILETPPLRLAWGFYFIARDASRPGVIVEAPHPLADEDSELTAAAVVRALKPGAFLLAGAHRYADPARRSDMAHTSISNFEEAHEALLEQADMVLQIHGFNDSTRPGYPEIVLSNATTSPDPTQRSLCEGLKTSGIDCVTYDGSTFTDLGATTNVQAGEASRILGEGHFLHFETAQRLRNNASKVEILNQALNESFPAAALPRAPIDVTTEGCATESSTGVLSAAWAWLVLRKRRSSRRAGSGR